MYMYNCITKFYKVYVYTNNAAGWYGALARMEVFTSGLREGFLQGAL